MTNIYLKNFQKKLLELKLDGFLVTNTVNVQYLSGFTGDDSFLFVTPNKAFLITDFRYVVQAREELKNVILIRHKKGLFNMVLELIKKHRARRIGFEPPSMNVLWFKELKKGLSRDAKWVPTSYVIEQLRSIKTPEEIRVIRGAVRCAQEAYAKILKFIRPGQSEIAIANQFEVYIRQAGALKSSFGPIIAVDERAALPHAPLSAKKTSANCLVLLDFGAFYNLYSSDITRTIYIGKMPAKVKEIYKIVQDAQERAIELVKPGEMISALDEAARGYIKKMGYGQYFGHALGHGIGRGGHEMPGIRGTTKQKLEPGMVFTVEPGIYLPNKFGVRIEDMVLVTDKGHEVLTRNIPKIILK